MPQRPFSSLLTLRPRPTTSRNWLSHQARIEDYIFAKCPSHSASDCTSGTGTATGHAREPVQPD